MKYPSVALGSSLSTPWGANGPGPDAPLVTLRNAVAVGVPPLAVPRRVALGMTNASDQLLGARAEHVAADVDRIGIDAEARIIQEASQVDPARGLEPDERE